MESNHKNPWLGPQSYGEADADSFFGRGREISHLTTKVKSSLLTIIHGRSGSGKSSLLRAGLAPSLRRSQHTPLFIRLSFSNTEKTLVEQVWTELDQAIGVFGKIKTPPASLWEWFSDRENGMQSFRYEGLSLVLIFDQFEEVFTLAKSNDRLEEVTELLTQLHSLAYDEIPESLQSKFDKLEETDSSAASTLRARYMSRKTNWRLVLSLRSEYIYHLDVSGEEFGAFQGARHEIRAFNRMQALEVVRKPALFNIEKNTSNAIVEKLIDQDYIGNSSGLSSARVSPAVLSMVCHELENDRQRRGDSRFETDTLEFGVSKIFENHYNRTLKNVSQSKREWLEMNLVNPRGNRESRIYSDVETAIGKKNLSRLITDRLLQTDQRAGVQRVEFIHDIFADIASIYRAEIIERKKQDEAEKNAAAALTQEELKRERELTSQNQSEINRLKHEYSLAERHLHSKESELLRASRKLSKLKKAAWGSAAIAIGLTLVSIIGVYQARNYLFDAKEEANSALDSAEKEAEQALANAEKAKKEADEAKKEADEAKKEADEAKKEADEAKESAMAATKAAEEAKKAENKALEAKRVADADAKAVRDAMEVAIAHSAKLEEQVDETTSIVIAKKRQESSDRFLDLIREKFEDLSIPVSQEMRDDGKWMEFQEGERLVAILENERNRYPSSEGALVAYSLSKFEHAENEVLFRILKLEADADAGNSITVNSFSVFEPFSENFNYYFTAFLDRLKPDSETPISSMPEWRRTSLFRLYTESFVAILNSSSLPLAAEHEQIPDWLPTLDTSIRYNGEELSLNEIHKDFFTNGDSVRLNIIDPISMKVGDSTAKIEFELDFVGAPDGIHHLNIDSRVILEISALSEGLSIAAITEERQIVDDSEIVDDLKESSTKELKNYKKLPKVSFQARREAAEKVVRARFNHYLLGANYGSTLDQSEFFEPTYMRNGKSAEGKNVPRPKRNTFMKLNGNPRVDLLSNGFNYWEFKVTARISVWRLGIDSNSETGTNTYVFRFLKDGSNLPNIKSVDY